VQLLWVEFAFHKEYKTAQAIPRTVVLNFEQDNEEKNPRINDKEAVTDETFKHKQPTRTSRLYLKT
jgi:hypothetical protein